MHCRVTVVDFLSFQLNLRVSLSDKSREFYSNAGDYAARVSICGGDAREGERRAGSRGGLRVSPRSWAAGRTAGARRACGLPRCFAPIPPRTLDSLSAEIKKIYKVVMVCNLHICGAPFNSVQGLKLILNLIIHWSRGGPCSFSAVLKALPIFASPLYSISYTIISQDFWISMRFTFFLHPVLSDFSDKF